MTAGSVANTVGGESLHEMRGKIEEFLKEISIDERLRNSLDGRRTYYQSDGS